MAKKWSGQPPHRCELCGTKIRFIFVDGQTVMGPWAVMCAKCFEDCGVGLGTGKGQLYARVDPEAKGRGQEWQQVAG